MTGEPWTFEARKRHRRHRPRGDQPRVFRFRASLREVGGIARLLRRHGFEVTIPRRISPEQWTIRATAPDGLSTDRLVRLCNLIDRTAALGSLVSVNVRIFRWLGRDRRQPARFYRGRRGR